MKMNVLIIEDEAPAALWLKSLLKKIDPEISIIHQLQDVASSILWLSDNPAPDLIFMDIRLSDGISLEIFRHTSITCPIVFTTAYDIYWQEAFRLNGIDYILKPITEERLAACLNKFRQFKQLFFNDQINALLEHQMGIKSFKTRFIFRKGTELVVVEAIDIAYIYSKEKLTFLITKDGKKYMPGENLSDFELLLDPAVFYRLNRQVIASRTAIKTIYFLNKSKLSIALQPEFNDELIISSEKSGDFKTWLES